MVNTNTFKLIAGISQSWQLNIKIPFKFTRQ